MDASFYVGGAASNSPSTAPGVRSQERLPPNLSQWIPLHLITDIISRYYVEKHGICYKPQSLLFSYAIQG